MPHSPHTPEGPPLGVEGPDLPSGTRSRCRRAHSRRLHRR